MNRPTIVIMDEDPYVAATLSALLNLKGYETEIGGHTPQPDRICESRHCIVLVDLKQHNQTGREVLDQVRQEYPDAETIILTGCSTLDLAIEATGSWAYSYILNPDKPEPTGLIKTMLQ